MLLIRASWLYLLLIGFPGQRDSQSWVTMATQRGLNLGRVCCCVVSGQHDNEGQPKPAKPSIECGDAWRNGAAWRVAPAASPTLEGREGRRGPSATANPRPQPRRYRQCMQHKHPLRILRQWWVQRRARTQLSMPPSKYGNCDGKPIHRTHRTHKLYNFDRSSMGSLLAHGMCKQEILLY